MKAYNELITRLYSQEDREKIEWAIGAALAGGPQKVLVISGPPASGKSTMLRIVESIFDREGFPDDVVVKHEGFDDQPIRPSRLFVASNRPMITSSSDMIVATTTGNLHSRSEYDRLTAEVKSEMDTISNACLNQYLSMGLKYYDDLTLNNYIQENSR